MLSTAVKVLQNSNIEGSGLVADRLITAGEIIFQFDDTAPPVHLYELIHWPPQKRARFFNFAIQLGEDEWCFRQGDIKFMNHACDPNAWWEGYGTLTARRDIGRNEEVTFDYSTSEIKLTWEMECSCGSSSCRGVVTNKDYLGPDFQKKYEGHFPLHVVEAIHMGKSKESGARVEVDDQLPEHVVNAVRQARLHEDEFREKYGDQYIFEMVRQLVIKK